MKTAVGAVIIVLLCGVAKAAPCPDAAACQSAGAAAAQADDDDAARAAFTRACNFGDGLSCVQLGQHYAKRDANHWLHRAVTLFDQGCTASRGIDCYWLGISRERGVAVAVDARKAVALYHRACALGHVPGCTNEAGMYLTGHGVPMVDTANAELLYEHACDAGDQYACYWAGHILDGELALTSGARPALAAVLARAPAPCDAGHVMGCYLLAVRSLAAARFPEAATQLAHACDLGSAWGCFALGDLTFRGIGVTADLGKGAGFYRKVCDREVGGNEGFETECNAIVDRMGL